VVSTATLLPPHTSVAPNSPLGRSFVEVPLGYPLGAWPVDGGGGPNTSDLACAVYEINTGTATATVSSAIVRQGGGLSAYTLVHHFLSST